MEPEEWVLLAVRGGMGVPIVRVQGVAVVEWVVHREGQHR